MKNFYLTPLLYLLILIPFSCNAQSSSGSQFARTNGGTWHTIDYLINSRADSLNLWKPGDKIPEFLFDKNLDHHRSDILMNFKGDSSNSWFLSLRQAIISRVWNTNVLKAILELEDERLDEIYDPASYYERADILKEEWPRYYWMEYSTRELVKNRHDYLLMKKKE
ncbi:MAG: hypothetical protein WBG62_19460 [Cyclobacteriaceae bacterium]